MIKSGSPQPLGNFEEQLLAELSAVVAQRAADPGPDPAPAGGPAPGRRRARRRLVPATLAGAVVAAAVVAVVHIGGGARPAYAVDKQADGSVVISLRDTRRLDGLPERLAEAGLPALVVPITASCPPVRLTPLAPSMSMDLDPVLTAKPGTTVRVQVRGTIPAGQILVFGVADAAAVAAADGWVVLVDGGFTTHPPTCLPVRKFPPGRVGAPPGK
ncbi:MAG TPA: hypothetical protein VMU51_31290 [Mycobacteriales bacterium]|nr:hypothetical protein [Mycobacteriales bacterium]